MQAALERLMRGHTSFVIAHRLSTIMNADRIVVMVGGRIVDFGTHAELVARPGVYQNLYNEQYKSAHEQALEALFAWLPPSIFPLSRSVDRKVGGANR